MKNPLVFFRTNSCDVSLHKKNNTDLSNGSSTNIFQLILNVDLLCVTTTFAKLGDSMFSFLGLRKDPKKSTSDRETDGFVIIGDTVEEQRQKTQTVKASQLATNVIVEPSKPSGTGAVRTAEGVPQPPALPPVMSSLGPATVEVALSLPELLGDVPFTLAPHILAMQAGFPLLPELLLSRDINDNLANFHYDFTLENSVLCDL